MKAPTPQIRSSLRIVCFVVGSLLILASLFWCLGGNFDFNFLSGNLLLGGVFLLYAWRGQ